MNDFAARTGLLVAEQAPVRYLWTDAFAVCNLIGIAHEYDSRESRHLAGRLVEQVHEVLGRHRPDDPRHGWLSGLDEAEGRRHPTAGGLRIGKPLPERGADQPADEREEWDRDGQYFHYLVQWMHALDQLGRFTGESCHRRRAIELAKVAHARFRHRIGGVGPPRLYWKMSIDLSRPLVSSMGQHDALAALVTYTQLQASGGAAPDMDLSHEIEEARQMCASVHWPSEDPLGIGGLLIDACRWAQLVAAGAAHRTAVLEDLLWASAQSLMALTRTQLFGLPADRRIAFRELGLGIGLRGVAVLQRLFDANPEAFTKREDLEEPLRIVAQYRKLADDIAGFWSDSGHRHLDSWRGHQDINDVMLATSLMPDGYLRLGLEG